MNTVKAYITAHWKAIMPLVALVVSGLVDAATNIDTDFGWKQTLLGIGSSILVYLKANTGPKAP